MSTGPLLATAVNLNGPGRYLHWSIFIVSEANLVLIAVMVVIFGAALLLPFPGHGTRQRVDGRRPWPETTPTGLASPLDRRHLRPTWETTPMRQCGHLGSDAARCDGCRRASCCRTASPPTSLRGSTSSAWPAWPR